MMVNMLDTPPKQQLTISCEIVNLSYLLSLKQLSFINSVIIYNNADLKAWDATADIIKHFKAHNIIVILKSDVDLAQSLGADGIHVEHDVNVLKELKLAHKELMIGYGAPQDKHTAMLAGEYGADYLFFGTIGKDLCPKPHTRNLELCQWWTKVMVIPAIIQCGNSLDNIVAAQQTNAEYLCVDNLILNSFDKNQTIEYIIESLKAHVAA